MNEEKAKVEKKVEPEVEPEVKTAKKIDVNTFLANLSESKYLKAGFRAGKGSEKKYQKEWEKIFKEFRGN